MFDDTKHRLTVEAAYEKLRETLEAKDVSIERLKEAALEALDHTREQIQINHEWVAAELKRLQRNPPKRNPPTKSD